MILIIGAPLILIGLAGLFFGGRPSRDANERTETAMRRDGTWWGQ